MKKSVINLTQSDGHWRYDYLYYWNRGDVRVDFVFNKVTILRWSEPL